MFEFAAISRKIQIRPRFQDERIIVQKRIASESVWRRRCYVAPFERLSHRLHLVVERGTFDDICDVLTGSAEDEHVGNVRRVGIGSRMKAGTARALRKETGVHRLLRPEEGCGVGFARKKIHVDGSDDRMQPLVDIF